MPGQPDVPVSICTTFAQAKTMFDNAEDEPDEDGYVEIKHTDGTTTCITQTEDGNTGKITFEGSCEENDGYFCITNQRSSTTPTAHGLFSEGNIRHRFFLSPITGNYVWQSEVLEDDTD